MSEEKPVVKIPETTESLPVMEEYTLIHAETGPIEITAPAGSPRELYEMLYGTKPGVDIVETKIGEMVVQRTAFFTEATVRLLNAGSLPAIDIQKGWLDDEGDGEEEPDPEDDDEEDEPTPGKRIPKFLRRGR